MANTAAVSVQIDPELKKNAESILSQLGITPSSAIQMLYSQVILSGGLPFQPCLPCRPTAVGGMTREQLNAELQKGIDSVQNGAVYTQEEMDAVFSREFGV